MSTRIQSLILFALTVVSVSCRDHSLDPPIAPRLLDLGPMTTRTYHVWHPNVNGPIYMAFSVPPTSNTVRERRLDGSERDICTIGTIPPGRAFLWSVNRATGALVVSSLVVDQSGSATDARLEEYALDGTRLGTFSGPAGTLDGFGVFSPDGTRMAFLRQITGHDVYELMWRAGNAYSSSPVHLWNYGGTETVVQISWLSNELILVAGTSDDSGQTLPENLVFSVITGSNSYIPYPA